MPHPIDKLKTGLYLPKWIDKHLTKKKRFTHPDLWTETYCNALVKFHSDQQKPIPATQRYKLCGNAVTATMVQAVAERLEIIKQ